jgi:hypothetical protein
VGQLAGKFRYSKLYNFCELDEVMLLPADKLQGIKDIDEFEKAVLEYKRVSGMALTELGAYGIMPSKYIVTLVCTLHLRI